MGCSVDCAGQADPAGGSGFEGPARQLGPAFGSDFEEPVVDSAGTSAFLSSGFAIAAIASSGQSGIRGFARRDC